MTSEERDKALKELRDAVEHNRDQCRVLSRSEKNRLDAIAMTEWLLALDALIASERQAKRDCVSAQRAMIGAKRLPDGWAERIEQYARDLAPEGAQ